MMTTPISGVVCHPYRLGLATINLRPYYEDMTGGAKIWKMEWFGVVRGHSRSRKIASFDSAYELLFMAALRSRCGYYIFALLFLSIFLSFFPRLISAAA